MPNVTIKSSSIRCMENTLERLRCLDYEAHISKRIAFDEFLLPANNTAFQFDLYMELASWLIRTIRHKDDTVKSLDFEDYEDPNAIVQNLMLSLRSLNYNMDFPIAKLKQPFGDIVCSVLDFLSRKALESSGFEFQKPKYVNEPQKMEAGSDDEDMIVEDDTSLSNRFGYGQHDEEDQENDVGTTAVNFSNNDDWNASISNQEGERISKNKSINDSNNDTATNQSQFDPVEWKREVERVSTALLELKFENRHDSWRNQVECIFTESQNFEKEFQSSRTVFERLCKDSSGTLRQMEGNESALHEKCHQIGREHQDISRKIARLESNREQSKNDLMVAREKLLAATNRLVEVKARVEEKGSSITDTSQLVRIKTALQDIKTDIRTFDLEIGILEHTLLHKRLGFLATN